ncbi:MAG: NosD domain-containing protein [Caldilineaceae bacterium]
MRQVLGRSYRAQAPVASSLSVSLVIPVYNENPTVFAQGLRSWIQENPKEVIAVIDHTDKACLRVFRAFMQVYTGARLIVTKKPGKRPALVDGIRAATGDIVALVDSDTIWGEGVLSKVVTPFADPKVGGVAPRQNVLKPRGLAQWLFDIHMDIRYNDEMRFLAATGDALTCISGRTAVYRRDAVLPLLDELLNETFWGEPVISGDDKCLTHLLQGAGWSVRYQHNARVYTPAFPQMSVFLQQRLRWARNSWRADLKALGCGWLWRKPALAFHLIDRLFQPITALLAPTFFLLSLYHQEWTAAVAIVGWWLVSRTIKIWPHLLRRPAGILMVPAYTFFSWIFVIVRIYAFFTMNAQGWITRWDRSRLKHVQFLRLIPSYVATAAVICTVVVVMNTFIRPRTAQAAQPYVFGTEADLPNYSLVTADSEVDQLSLSTSSIEVTNRQDAVAVYQFKGGDTAERVMRRYGVQPAAGLLSLLAAKQGAPVQFPLPFLEPALYRQSLPTLAKPGQIAFESATNTISIKGYDAVVTMPALYAELQDETLLAYEGDGVYLLKANLELSAHTTLLIEGPKVSWLKLQSNDAQSVRIYSRSGSILISDVKISSWDTQRGDYDHNYADGRSHIRINDGRMDIVNADIGYLGSPILNPKAGGSYGLSWRIVNPEHFGQQLTTGYVENSRIHHNYFGIYTFGATGMVIRNNKVYENVQYGIDPHDDSNNFLVEDNEVYNNGNHGIIFSKRCFNNVIRHNRVIHNRLHGIMLDQQTNRNSVYENYLLDNVDGVTLVDSHDNAIYDNQIINNQQGVRISRDSTRNLISENQISNSKKHGIHLYAGAAHNWIVKNQIERGGTGAYIRSSDNYVVSNRIAETRRGVYLRGDEISGNHIQGNTFIGAATAIYLKTTPANFLAKNEFGGADANAEHIRVGRDWYTTLAVQEKAPLGAGYTLCESALQIAALADAHLLAPLNAIHGVGDTEIYKMVRDFSGNLQCETPQFAMQLEKVAGGE